MNYITRAGVMRRCSLVLMLVVCIPVTHFAQSDDERAVRELVNSFFAAYQKGDLKVIESLLSAKSPDYAATKEKIQKVLADTEKLEIKNLTVRRLNIDGSVAAVRILAAMSALDRKTKAPARGFGKMDFTLRAAKENGSWKVSQFLTSAEDLAAKLIAAQTEEERKRLLAANEDLVTAELGKALATQGASLLKARKYRQTFVTFELAKNIAVQTGDKVGALIAWQSMGIVEYYQGNYTQSREYLQKSLSLAEELGDRKKVATLYTNLGILNMDQGETGKAVEYYKKSLATSEGLGAKDLIAGVLINLGDVYRTQGDYPKALEALRRSVELNKEIGEKGDAAIGLNRIGLVSFDQGNYAEALEDFETYLAIANEMKDKGYMSSALNNIGMVYYGQKNFAKSLEYYQKALALKEELGNKPGIANTSNSIGAVYEGQGDYGKALEYYRKCMSLSEQLGFKPQLTLALHNTGNVFLAQGDYVKALEVYQRSLKLVEEMEDKEKIATALNSIGLAHHKLGNYAQALDDFQKSLSVAESIGDKDGVATTLQSMSAIQYDQGNFAKSVEYADRASAVAKQIGNLDVLWQARTTGGKAHRALNQAELAQSAFGEAISTIENVRSNIAGGEEEQEQFFENKLSPYQGMIGLLVDQHKDGEALSYAERAKARVLLDVLRNGKVDVAKAMTTQEQERELRMRNVLTAMNTQIEREQGRPQPDSKLLTDLKARLQTARLEYDTFQTTLYAAHPDLKVQRAEANPVTMREVSALIPDSQTALLEYVVADDKTYLFVSTKTGGTKQNSADLKTFVLGVKRKDLAEKAMLFRNQLARRDLGFGELANQLYDLLIKPAQAQIQGKTNLLIVPDGALWELPFQALESGQGRFLLEDHAVSYVPSATVLQEMVALRKRRINKPVASANLLAFGNPALGTKTLERVALTRGDEKLLPLPETEREVKYLSQLYGSSQSKVFIAAEASEDRLKSEAPKFTILHLATHGILNDASPMYSQIVLSQGDAGANEDGLLEAWEIMKMDLKADLVVLSACETARGRVGEGEGMIGLNWALFVAGSPTNIVSQWKVDSNSTTQLMVEFHRNLKNGLSKGRLELGTAKALQQAAMSLLRTSTYRHPFYWAGFVVMGDGF
jgi:CHAT domain-containing protein/tetratricopeptide (TPR) repeat protein